MDLFHRKKNLNNFLEVLGLGLVVTQTTREEHLG
jgi:hypothetical protein